MHIFRQTFETDEEEKSENKDDVTDFNFDDSSLRKKLSKVGVYQRHDVNSLVLDSFGRYLQNYFGDYSIKQMLYSVSCYLYFINPDEISLDFLNDLEKTQKYVTTLLGVKASVSTIKNRLNHIEHFIKFVISEDFPNDVDEDKKQAAETFLKGLRRLKANVRPVPKKGPKQCRHRIRGDLTPKESCRVLTVSESLVMDLFAQARSGSELEVMDKMLAWYYLKALLLLKYLYKPAVLHNLTVKSWLERKSYTHREGSVTKTVAIIKTRRKIILLQPEEEKVRPASCHRERCETFF
ncbi:uncharacterized protein RB166_005525 isoform 2-T2 [Leptodactylus fuscus]|uniref:uncharacterized protein LOC142196865 isoform X2 n=1 Tax=Leptodactylus fuscus TaxID=238119 RepID=UPI003F4F1BB0